MAVPDSPWLSGLVRALSGSVSGAGGRSRWIRVDPEMT